MNGLQCQESLVKLSHFNRSWRPNINFREAEGQRFLCNFSLLKSLEAICLLSLGRPPPSSFCLFLLKWEGFTRVSWHWRPFIWKLGISLQQKTPKSWCAHQRAFDFGIKFDFLDLQFCFLGPPVCFLGPPIQIAGLPTLWVYVWRFQGSIV